jgi:transcriptional regulator with XRE-family HTH domain
MGSRAKPRESYQLTAKSEWHQRLGQRFRREREKRDVTLRAIAESIGCCSFTLRRHEAGEMMLRTDDLVKAAEAIGVEPTALLVAHKRRRKPKTERTDATA